MSQSLAQAQADVAEFMRIAGQASGPLPPPDADALLLTLARMCESFVDLLKRARPTDVRHLRARLMLEELGETLEGLAKSDEVMVAGGLVDLLYVAIGTGVAFDIPLPAVWDAVQTANLAKFPGGVALVDENGKVVKPEGWKPPDVAEVLRAAREEAARLSLPTVVYNPFVEDDYRYRVTSPEKPGWWNTYGLEDEVVAALKPTYARVDLLVIEQDAPTVQWPNVSWTELAEILDQVRSRTWYSTRNPPGVRVERTQCQFSNGNGYVCRREIDHDGPHSQREVQL